MTSQAIPSYQRVEPGSVNLLVADLSQIKAVKPEEVDQATEQWVSSFNKAIQSSNLDGLTDLFLLEAHWRDHLCLAWDAHTLKIPDMIKFLKKGCRLRDVAVDKSSEFRSPTVTVLDGQGKIPGIQTFLTIQSDIGAGLGVARLVQQGKALKCFSLFTSMRELRGHEETIFGRRPEGVAHGGQPGRKNWLERREAEENCEDSEPTVLILGAGQGGLTPAARLKMLGVQTLIIDRNPRIGDNWRNRYHQLVLHDPVWYDHMPYVNFPPHWPIFTPKDKLANFFETYASLLELNVWTSTTIKESKWDPAKKRWTVVVERKKERGVSETRILHPKHIIQATGHSGEMNFPSHIPGIKDTFKGDRLCHSSQFSGAKMNGNGKKAIVVGCCNSGHDIAQDYFEKGYDVTMVQRSSTCVISSESILKIGLAGLYDEQGPPVEDADVTFWSIPSAVLKSIHIDVTALQNKNDAKLLGGLEKAGFKLDQGPDRAGLFMKYFQRGGGYYIDVGASQLIIDGKIKIKQGQEIAEVLPNGLKFADGCELAADEIIFATGYKNMRTQARSIFGDELADQVKDVWGFDEEGEVRTMWRKTGHPGFWFFGGNLALCRYWSRMIALQIKALEEGICEYSDR
ncbi:dimethylaniline monooxygenase (N-oxide forming) [Cadophora sp. DSE1049]|nr:dimethylaniline monooxygenase (N-oxide forming) [Cadophora sp. DSE1049]